MEQLVLLVIIGLISLINWVMQKAAEKREQAGQKRAERREIRRESKRNVYTQPAPGPVHRPVRRASGPTQDPFRELMEALGLPADQLPPPPVARREELVEEEEFASPHEARAAAAARLRPRRIPLLRQPPRDVRRAEAAVGRQVNREHPSTPGTDPAKGSAPGGLKPGKPESAGCKRCVWTRV